MHHNVYSKRDRGEDSRVVSLPLASNHPLILRSDRLNTSRIQDIGGIEESEAIDSTIHGTNILISDKMLHEACKYEKCSHVL